VRRAIATIAVSISFGLSFAGFMVLCACPVFYISAAVLASISLVAGVGRMKIYSTLALAVALAALPSQMQFKKSAEEAVKQTQERARQQEALSETNDSGPANSGR
jgi:flagellar biosynthesis component FlhA